MIGGKDIKTIDGTFDQNAKIFSFDVFDTLVLRNCSSPEVVFDIVEEEYNKRFEGYYISGFKEKRIEAEKKARKECLEEEITYDEIYDALEDVYGDQTKILKDIEFEIEKDICCPNFELRDYYNKIRDQRKNIIIVSDMYYSGWQIEEILKICGYNGYRKLYVSSDYRATKRSGMLYGIILRDFDISPKKILHIGDNFVSDYISPTHHRIKAVLYHRKNQRLFFYGKQNNELNIQKEQATAKDILRSFTKNNFSKEQDLAERVGVEVLGPILFGYIKWLHETVELEQPDCLAFLAREGRTFLEAWNIIYPQEKLRTEYIHVSRLAVCRASVIRTRNFSQLIKLMRPVLVHKDSMEDLLSVLGLDEATRERVYTSGIFPFMKISDLNDEERIYKIIIREGWRYFQDQATLFQSYIEDHGLSKGKIVLSDIGWNGTVQMLLEDLFPDVKWIGAYVGLIDDFKNSEYSLIDRREYLKILDSDKKKKRMMRISRPTLESLFLTNEGSTERYTREDGEIIPVTSESEYSNIAEHSVMRHAAFSFIQTINQDHSNILLDKFFPEIIVIPFIKLAVYPNHNTIDFFASFSCLNYEERISFTPNHGILYYIMHPKEMKMDIDRSPSKIIWLKGLLRLPFPYFGLLAFADEIGVKTDYNKRYISGENQGEKIFS